MTPIIGRTVLYRLSEADVVQINRRRDDAAENMVTIRVQKPGFQVHVGNRVSVGEVVSMVITAVWPNEYGTEPGVNGQITLDGTDHLWVTSVAEGEVYGQWHWPVREEK